MAERDIIQNLIVQLGQSQDERAAAELEPDYVRVDERTSDDLFAFSRRLAELVNYYAPASGAGAPAGNWTPWFEQVPGPFTEFVSRHDGDVPPHLTLFASFFELYRQPQAIANRLTAAHLDFYYRDVLRLQSRGAVRDRAHLLLELKKNATPAIITPQHTFSAGKDETGAELTYAPVTETVLSAARVASLRSIFVDPSGGGTVRFAPIADSADGLGGVLPADEPKWRAFGHAALPRAEVGFAIASPVLRLRQGARTITVRLKLTGIDRARITADAVRDAFGVFITGEKAWLEPDSVNVMFEAGDIVQWVMTLPASAPAIVDYDAAIHGYAFATDAPVLQLLLREGAVGYRDLAGVVVQRVQITVDVSGATPAAAESDAGALDARKAFLPFGPQPALGARLMLSYPEALSKKLSEATLTVEWQSAPLSFASHYNHYGVSGVGNTFFTAGVTFRDVSGTEFTDRNASLFDSSNASAPRELRMVPGSVASAPAAAPGQIVRALGIAGAKWSKLAAARHVLLRPALASFLRPVPAAREGFITFTLNRSFLHAEYRRKLVENVVTFGRTGGTLTVLNEPYTPTIQSIALSYRAYTDDVPVSSAALADFANPDVHFFHVAPFGPVREHGYQRAQFTFVSMKDVPLLPTLPHAGELLIGIADAEPGGSVSLLFQVASGSADPEAVREKLRWFVLADNQWLALGARELVLDTTNDLLASGIVKIVLPAAATLEHSLLPAGHIWIKASVQHDVRAVSELIAVAANGIEVQRVPHATSPATAAAVLPANRITKLLTPVAAVKSVKQPFAAFGGRAAESERSFRTRAAERLRHKNRFVTAWDGERLVLEAFPVHRVKVIPHARPDAWLAPGHVLFVVVPDLRNRNAVDPLQPRVDADMLTRIRSYVQERAGMQVQVAVKNPRYQKVRLDFQVRFHAGYEFNQYREELEQAIIRMLSPWAFDAQHEITFGGSIYRSVLLNFVEELPYVDYIADFRMYSFAGDIIDATDHAVVSPATPDTILVSDSSHTIVEAP